MTLVRILVGVTGGLVVVGTLASAISTVILPRSAQSIVSRAVFRFVRGAFSLVASERRTFEFRDWAWAFFAPVGLVALVAVWLGLVTGGFTLVYWSIEQGSWSTAFSESGSSITTLGFASGAGTGIRALEFIEAGIGLFLVALLITYLPTMYGAFSTRERRVALLEVRAGRPPSAAEFLLRYHQIGWMERLPETWLQWEEWFAHVEETHTSYPALNFFRSPQPGHSWVTAAGTVLDAAALWASVLDVDESAAPGGVMIRAGYLALGRIASFFGIAYDPDPSPGDPISITRGEFDEVVDRFAAAGMPVVADRDQAWEAFSGWRVNYDAVLLQLAEVTIAPIAPWTSDRSAPDHVAPRIRRWGIKVSM